MKIPLSWVSLYSDIWKVIAEKSIKEIAHYYSTHTAEVEGVEHLFFDKVVIGKVLSCEKHPDSKKLSIVQVSVGTETSTILTGAPNVIDATYVAVARIGAVLPWNFTIGERMMAGMKSSGMICSLDELWLSVERAEWIMILEEYWDRNLLESKIGTSFFDLTLPLPWKAWTQWYYSLKDTVFEIDNKSITNRSDLFSILGNAREFHTLFGTSLIEDERHIETDNIPTFPIVIETEKCMTYNALCFDAVKIDPSPFWIQVMMERAWYSPKLDMIDITNMIMVEYGQPLHVFDRDTITGTITIRMAHNGEKFLALNGIEYDLIDTDIVIADEKKILALAGIIGGKDSSVHANSRNILFESACFDATTIRLTAQRLALRTDASTRYEKSLDPTLAYRSLWRIVDYMDFLWKNTGITHFFWKPIVMDIEAIDVPYAFLDWKLGIVLDHVTIQKILSDLGCTWQEYSQWIRVTPPSWRATKDIKIKEDIAEEIGRVYGYEMIDVIAPRSPIAVSRKDTILSLQKSAIHHFATRGWDEVYNYSFTNTDIDTRAWYTNQDDAIIIKNAFNREYTHMRRSLFPRLAQNIAENQKYRKYLSFFEIGACISRSWEDSEAIKYLAWISTEYSLEKMRQDLESYFEHVSWSSFREVKQEGVQPFLHPNSSGTYSLNGENICSFGRLHPQTAKEFHIPEESLYFEVNLEHLKHFYEDREKVFHEIGKYQSIPRELNFILPERTPVWDVALQLGAVHPWIENVQVSSIFRDMEKVWEGKKAVTFSFILSNKEASLTDTDALEVQNRVIDALKGDGYELKGFDI